MQHENVNHAQANKFKLIFSKLPDVEFFCKSITLPSVSLDQTQASSPGFTLPLPGNKILYDPVSILYILDEDWNTWGSMMKWIQGFARDDGFVPVGEQETESFATVEILTNNENLNRRITFDGIFPINIESPSYDYATAGDMLLSATFAIQGLKFE